jgi:ATP-dependent Clp protease adaptor protein ClpS
MAIVNNSNDDKRNPDQGGGTGTQTLVQSKPRLQEPPMFKVILLNDDFTPMDFVVHILSKFFAKSNEEATTIMLQVHQQGSGVAGIFSHEIAETKVYLVNDYSKKNKHPLKCVMEKS